MQINISAQHFSLGESLQQYIHDKLWPYVSHYLEHAVRSEVHFNKVRHQFSCEIVLHTGVKSTIVSDSTSDDVYTSFDISLAKLGKQLRKYKSKLNDYHQKMKVSKIVETTKYIIDAQAKEYSDQDLAFPVIVAEKPMDIMSLSIKEAVMKMDLENLPTLVFNNIDTRRLNVVYYRKDGNISWVDFK
jgi:ribosomal subunit interface protein